MLALALSVHILPCFGQGTVFTYQGRLNDGGSPANGTNYGMVFYLYDAVTNGSSRTNSAPVPVVLDTFIVPPWARAISRVM